MNLIQIIFGSLVLILSVVAIISICAQQGKSQGLGALAGGTDSDTFFGKNRSRDKSSVLAKVTIIISILLTIAILVLNIFEIMGKK